MSRSARLLGLMQLLRRHRHPVSGAALAAALAISIRTLYRDIATLQSQGAAIDGAPGLGYVLKPGFVLPPLMFSADEIEALSLGTRWVAERGDPHLAAAARDALAKIGAVLPPGLRHEMDSSPLLVGPAADAPAAALLTAVRAAIRAEHKLQLAYRDAHGGASARTVWPFALGFFDRVQVLLAWCELRQSIRHFRVDRIVSLHTTGSRYAPRRQALLAAWRQQEGIAEP